MSEAKQNQNPVVLVTGSSSGIGEAIATHQARLGKTVFASMRNPDAGRELQELAATENLDIRLLRLDVTDDQSVASAVAKVISQTGCIDILINNAGISTIESVEGSLQAAKRAFEVNYFGMLRTISAVLPFMRERGSGVIINVSSAAGVAANAGSGAYAASKFAIEAMSESLAAETMSLGIRVIILEPGYIQTPIYEKVHRALGTEAPTGPYAKHIRRGRIIYSSLVSNRPPPSVVATVVEEALVDPAPKLRYQAGSAKRLITVRRRIPDEDWVGLGLIEDDDEWSATMANAISKFGAS